MDFRIDDDLWIISEKKMRMWMVTYSCIKNKGYKKGRRIREIKLYGGFEEVDK